MRKLLIPISILVVIFLSTTAAHSDDSLESVVNQAGLDYLHSGQFSSAIEKFNESIQINPNYPDAYLNLGMALWLTDNLVDAEKALLKADSLNASKLHTHYGLAHVYRDQGRCEEAKAEMRQYVSLARKQGSIDEAGHEKALEFLISCTQF